ncbi:substrate-binding domain-containing protein [Pseudarthrobacter enclensis]|uniref:substrate-binding domain-containing protein n=1 Tax=Pseudarthrobacter enclensis TaxID=993070 RepID=UPI003681710E
MSVPALTTVVQPLRDIGRAALRIILRQVGGEVPDSRRVELATKLVVRESTAAPRGEWLAPTLAATCPGAR